MLNLSVTKLDPVCRVGRHRGHWRHSLELKLVTGRRVDAQRGLKSIPRALMGSLSYSSLCKLYTKLDSFFSSIESSDAIDLFVSATSPILDLSLSTRGRHIADRHKHTITTTMINTKPTQPPITDGTRMAFLSSINLV
ncbi:hypothetical protein BpHYR1_042402 [Brachionus plicatilis]|uniref:Uncharacterized protein n=1 Tax=Brachionus plicatilis TaxID=10195 RepID=A0A3M7RII7_BRAPC|nr:hypothetical protein BpHYR1_042402 [Brachionus plicatilis]